MNRGSSATGALFARAIHRLRSRGLLRGDDFGAAFRTHLESGRLALRITDSVTRPPPGTERPELVAVGLVNARAAVGHLRAAQQATQALTPPETSASAERGEAACIDADAPPGVDADAPPGTAADALEHERERAHALLCALEAPLRRERAKRLAAAARLLALPAALVALLAGFWTWRYGAREISAGKAWKTSSVAWVCHPRKLSCGGARTKILFHTQTEAEPWFELDLGGVYELSAIKIKNRSDYCRECAVPLVVEVSRDARHYAQVARKFAVFDDWNAELPHPRARYVRLRVARTTSLHLEAVHVYGRPG